MMFRENLFFLVCFLILVSPRVHADCLEVVKPIALGQCRALPNTKKYIGSRNANKIWTYTCDYECATGLAAPEMIVATHRDRESHEMNSLTCLGVELDMIDTQGSIVRQCRRIVTPIEIFRQGGNSFLKLLGASRRFTADSSARERVVVSFATEMREIGLAYLGAANAASDEHQRAMLAAVASDLYALAAALQGDSAGAATLAYYRPFLERSSLKARSGTREGFVMTHLMAHRNLILNLMTVTSISVTL